MNLESHFNIGSKLDLEMLIFSKPALNCRYGAQMQYQIEAYFWVTTNIE